MLKTKDPVAFLKILAPRIAMLATIAIPGEEATRDAQDVGMAATAAGRASQD